MGGHSSCMLQDNVPSVQTGKSQFENTFACPTVAGVCKILAVKFSQS